MRVTNESNVVPHDALLDTAVDVARRLRVLDEYGSVARATGALRRRRPGFEPSDYARALTSALELLDRARVLAEENRPELQRRGQLSVSDRQQHARELERHHPGFPPATYDWLIGWVIYYLVLR